jgi:hypothetical protein
LAEQQLFFVGNQQPSITETITDENGLPIDLSSDSVRFKMRPVGSITLKVDAAVSNTPGADGVVRYDWSITDTDTPGRYLVWWEVTNTQGEKQDLAEALIEFRAHGPLSNSYIELEELKSSTELTSTSFADQDLQNAIVSASRAVDFYTGRRFWPDLVDQTRYFTGNGTDRVDIDDLIILTSLSTDPSDDGTYEYAWTTGIDYVLEPRNALLDGYPYTSIRRLLGGNYPWPSYNDSVKVVGKFGWSAPPEAVKVATTMLAARYVKRTREAPFGVAGFDATGATVRISATDPDVQQLLAPLARRPLFA